MSNLMLEKQLCFKLYSLNKTLTKLYTPILKALDLTYPQYLVMLVLWEKDEPRSIKEIGQALTLDSGTLSPLLKRMEKNGLVSRERCEDDERAVYISLTYEGKQLEDKAKPIPEQLFAMTGLNKDEMISLQQTLTGLIETTQQHVQ